MSAVDSEIAWIDQAYDSDLLVNQYNYFGKYNGGFWNSIIGQSGVKKASVGYSFLAIEDDVYLYTGVTSVTSDDSILGFFLINQRTKEAKFYNTTGAPVIFSFFSFLISEPLGVLCIASLVSASLLFLLSVFSLSIFFYSISSSLSHLSISILLSLFHLHHHLLLLLSCSLLRSLLLFLFFFS